MRNSGVARAAARHVLAVECAHEVASPAVKFQRLESTTSTRVSGGWRGLRRKSLASRAHLSVLRKHLCHETDGQAPLLGCASSGGQARLATPPPHPPPTPPLIHAAARGAPAAAHGGGACARSPPVASALAQFGGFWKWCTCGPAGAGSEVGVRRLPRPPGTARGQEQGRHIRSGECVRGELEHSREEDDKGGRQEGELLR